MTPNEYVRLKDRGTRSNEVGRLFVSCCEGRITELCLHEISTNFLGLFEKNAAQVLKTVIVWRPRHVCDDDADGRLMMAECVVHQMKAQGMLFLPKENVHENRSSSTRVTMAQTHIRNAPRSMSGSFFP